MQWYTSATHLWSLLQKRRHMQYANLSCGFFLLAMENVYGLAAPKNSSSFFITRMVLEGLNDQEWKLGCGRTGQCW